MNKLTTNRNMKIAALLGRRANRHMRLVFNCSEVTMPWEVKFILNGLKAAINDAIFCRKEEQPIPYELSAEAFLDRVWNRWRVDREQIEKFLCG